MSLQPWGESEVEFYAAQFLCIHMYTYMYVYLFKKKTKQIYVLYRIFTP